jgi:hypothetical protein
MAALSYAASTFQCTPAALAQPGGFALGAQAGPAAIRELASDSGFSQFRQVTQTPVNDILELRPQRVIRSAQRVCGQGKRSLPMSCSCGG